MGIVGLLIGACPLAAKAQLVNCATLTKKNTCEDYAKPPKAPFWMEARWYTCDWQFVDKICVAKLSAPPLARRMALPGDMGNDVYAIQKLLNSKGFIVNVTGSYDRQTEAAVKAFQTQAGMQKVDGKAGPETLGALRN